MMISQHTAPIPVRFGNQEKTPTEPSAIQKLVEKLSPKFKNIYADQVTLTHTNRTSREEQDYDRPQETYTVYTYHKTYSIKTGRETYQFKTTSSQDPSNPTIFEGELISPKGMVLRKGYLSSYSYSNPNNPKQDYDPEKLDLPQPQRRADAKVLEELFDTIHKQVLDMRLKPGPKKIAPKNLDF